MKKNIILGFLIALSTNVFGQIFTTKTGQINFDASGGLETIAAVNNAADAKFQKTSGDLAIAVLTTGFVFENSLMNDHFQENYIESSKYPKALFKGKISNLAEINFSKPGTYNVTINGTLNLHGQTKTISANGSIEITNDHSFAMKGTFPIKLADFKIGGKYIGDKIAEKVQISVLINFKDTQN